jgi:hypothetical protein
MNVGVIGSRNFRDYNLVVQTLSQIEISSIVSGGAEGADSLAEKYAQEKSIPTKIHLPNWALGKSAAAIRNSKIVDDSDIIVAFWDGASKGTKMTITMAEKRGKKVILKIYK